MAIFRHFKHVLKALVLALFVLSSPVFACETNEIEYNGECFESKFEITTTDTIASGDYIAFKISAKGVFYVDWGDGKVDRIPKAANTQSQVWSHTYTYDENDETSPRPPYTIRFGGVATGYNTSTDTPAIGFYNGSYSVTSYNENKSVTLNYAKIAGISGSLGALFPTIETVTNGVTTYSQPSFYRTFYNCSSLEGSIPGELFAGIYGTPVSNMFDYTFCYCSKLTGQIPENLFSGITGELSEYTFYGTFSGASNLGKDKINGVPTYSVPVKLFNKIDPDSSVSNGMSYVFNNTGLLTSCPGGTNQATTGFESYFDSKVACVDDEELYCKQGMKYDSTNMACIPCDDNDTCDTGFVEQCPDGYAGNATSTQCFASYTINYHLNGGDNNADNPSIYTKESSTITLQIPTKTGFVFKGWYTDSGFEHPIATIPSGSEGDIDLYAKWGNFESKFQITTTDDINNGDYFAFQMSAAGMFYVDWGDNSGIEVIDRTNNTTNQAYSHTYRYDENGSRPPYTIKFDGVVMRYSDVSASTAAISFYNSLSMTSANENKSVTLTSTKIAGISGSLGALFPTIGGAAATIGYAGTDKALWAIQPRFANTFSSCSNLEGQIPEGLFDGISGTPASYMFYQTFSGCSKLTGSIPESLFADISGALASSSFYGTFHGCTNLGKNEINGTSAYYVPAKLFAGITTVSSGINNVFYGTGLLTACPSGTNQAITGFESYFSNKVACVNNDELYCKYGMKYDSTNMSCVSCDSNDTCDTGFIKECLPGYAGNATSTQCITAYTIDYNLDGGDNNTNNPSIYTTESSTITLRAPTKNGFVFRGWYTDSSFTNLITTIPVGSTGNKTLYAKWDTFDSKFQVTTTDITNDDYVAFVLSASGVFYVDWGDNSDIELIDRTNNTTNQAYSHTYKNDSARPYTIKFDGTSFAYNNTSNSIPTIGFYYNSSMTSVNESKSVALYNSNSKIAGISGSLGALFPTIETVTNDVTTYSQPRFYQTFYQCSNLEGQIPEDLFTGIFGTPVSYMFYNTFSNCSNLTGSIPEKLFSGISGAPASYMFYQTFRSCSKLTGSIPEKLFENIKGNAADYMFYYTFAGCSQITGYVPPTLFSGITAGSASNYMSGVFNSTGLVTSCDTSVSKKYTTGFESQFSSKVSCILNTEVVCGDNNTFDGVSCGTCTEGTVGCPINKRLHACDDGYIANSTNTDCVFVYNLHYAEDEYITNNPTKFPSTYTVDKKVSVNNPLKSGERFVGWCIYDSADNDGTNCQNPQRDFVIEANTITGDRWLYPVYGPIPNEYKFSVKTTSTSMFGFTLSASGEFWVDWGDGTIEYYERGGIVTNTTYKHTYNTTGSYTVRIGGLASGYSTTYDVAALSFNVKIGNNNYSSSYARYYVNKIAGSLGALFPTIQKTTNGTTTYSQPKFYYTFNNCINFVGIDTDSDLVNYSIDDPKNPGLQYALPPDLFTGIYGQPVGYMFDHAFYGNTALAGTLPDNLFGHLYGVPTYYGFRFVFSNDTKLVGNIPDNLFGSFDGSYSGTYMYDGAFSGCSNLGKKTVGGTSAYYVSPTLFRKVTNYQINSQHPLNNSGVLTTCDQDLWPDTKEYTLLAKNILGDKVSCIKTNSVICDYGFDDVTGQCVVCSDSDDVCLERRESHVYECLPGMTPNETMEDCVAVQEYEITYHVDENTVLYDTYSTDEGAVLITPPAKEGYGFAGWFEQADFSGDRIYSIATGDSGEKEYYAKWLKYELSVTTTEISGGDYFGFQLYSPGYYVIDWGDGTEEYADTTKTGSTGLYSHAYPAEAETQEYVVRLAGEVTGTSSGSVIAFGNSASDTSTYTYTAVNGGPTVGRVNVRNKVKEVSGSLAKIFTVLQSNMYNGVFQNCSNLEKISSDLFDGGVDVEPTSGMFSYAFYGCKKLEEIQSGLFDRIKGPINNSMFYETFYGCEALTAIPENLFAGLTDNTSVSANYAFDQTFYGCIGLTDLPKNLFPNITLANRYEMFGQMFAENENLGTGTINYIPATMFVNMDATNYANSAMFGIFTNTNLAESCPVTDGLRNFKTGFESYFSNKVSCVKQNEFVCKSNQKPNEDGEYVAGTRCVDCTAGEADCPEYPVSYDCPPNYAVDIDMNDNYSANICVPEDEVPDVYLITYNVPSGVTHTNKGFYDSAEGITLKAANRSGYIFTGWCLDGETDEECDQHNYMTDAETGRVFLTQRVVAAGTTGDLTFAARYEEAPFSVSKLSGNSTFKFNLSAKGKFWVNWGDGTIEYIERSDTQDTSYEHTYADSDYKTISFAGDATGYNNNEDSPVAAISFYTYNGYVSGIGGSLGQIFHTIYDETGTQVLEQPRFIRTFKGSSYASTIPATIFDGVSGAPVSSMFEETFAGFGNNYRYNNSNYNYGLTIPATLFSGISGAPAKNLFKQTFYNCGKLGTLPSQTLFSTIVGAPAEGMFEGTFMSCNHMNGTLDATLFAGIRGAPAKNMFKETFYGCSALTSSIPENLFGRGVLIKDENDNDIYDGISGPAAEAMFQSTFNNSKLSGTIPENLFGRVITDDEGKETYYGITGSAPYMFAYTFSSCSNLSGTIPENLFGCVITDNEGKETYYGVTGTAPYMFSATFSSCSNLSGTIPEKLFGRIIDGQYYGVSGAPQPYMFNGTFSSCSGLTGEIPSRLFAGIHGNPDSYPDSAFYHTFLSCSNLGTGTHVPPLLLAEMPTNYSSMTSGMLNYTGLTKGECPAGTNRWYTGFDYQLDTYNHDRYSCIDDDKILCKANQKPNDAGQYVAGTRCVSCEAGTEGCPSLANIYDCPIGYYVGTSTTYVGSSTYAQCSSNVCYPRTYNITYDFDSSEYSNPNTKTTYDITETPFNLVVPTHVNGGEMVGWCLESETDDECDAKHKQVGDQVVRVVSTGTHENLDFSVRSITVLSTSTITYNTDGGTLSGNGITTVTENAEYTQEYGTSDTVVVPAPTREGFIFAGWCMYNSEQNNGANCDKNDRQLSVTIPEGSVGDRWLYATWTRIYSIHYYNVDDAVNNNPDTFVPGISVESTKPIKDGYVFMGWCAYTNSENVGLCRTYERYTSLSDIISNYGETDLYLYATYVEDAELYCESSSNNGRYARFYINRSDDYNYYVNAYCEGCPAGYECPYSQTYKLSEAEVNYDEWWSKEFYAGKYACSGNTYSNGWAISCSTCPGGSTANSEHTTCDCGNNYIMNRTNKDNPVCVAHDAITCPAESNGRYGRYAYFENYDKEKGRYLSFYCTGCRPGYYCDGGTYNYNEATQIWYNWNYYDGCQQDPSSNSCNWHDTGVGAKRCSGNTYSKWDATSCSTCPTTAADHNTSCSCAEDYFFDTNNGICKSSTSATADPGRYVYWYYDSGDGWYDTGCSRGYYCPGGTYTRDDAEYVREEDQYRYGPAGRISCGEGKYSAWGSSSPSACKTCPTSEAHGTGIYDSNKNECGCEEGYTWNSTQEACVFKCPDVEAMAMYGENGGAMLTTSGPYYNAITQQNECLGMWVLLEDASVMENMESVQDIIDAGTSIMLCKYDETAKNYVGACSKAAKMCDVTDYGLIMSAMQNGTMVETLINALNENNSGTQVNYANMFDDSRVVSLTDSDGSVNLANLVVYNDRCPVAEPGLVCPNDADNFVNNGQFLSVPGEAFIDFDNDGLTVADCVSGQYYGALWSQLYGLNTSTLTQNSGIAYNFKEFIEAAQAQGTFDADSSLNKNAWVDAVFCRYNPDSGKYDKDCTNPILACGESDFYNMEFEPSILASTGGAFAVVMMLPNSGINMSTPTWKKDLFIENNSLSGITLSENNVCSANCDFGYSYNALSGMCLLTQYECDAGEYLKLDTENNTLTVEQCEENHYCVAGTWTINDIDSTTNTAGMTACPEGATSSAGSDTCSCPMGYSWNMENNTCDAVVCPEQNHSYTNIPQDGSAGILEMGSDLIKSYGSTQNECVTLRLYYENGEPLMPSEFESTDINDWIAAGSSVAFCRYNPQTGNYDDKCSKKYLMCADQDMNTFMTLVATQGSIGVLNYMLGFDTPEQFDEMLTENPADLASETAINNCCPEGFVCCAGGKYLKVDGESKVCDTCPAGYYCVADSYEIANITQSTGAVACAENTFSGEGESSCTSCVEGSSSGEAASACVCTPGYTWANTNVCEGITVNIDWVGVELGANDPAKTCTYGDMLNVPDDEPELGGYTFIGWTTGLVNSNNNIENGENGG